MVSNPGQPKYTVVALPMSWVVARRSSTGQLIAVCDAATREAAQREADRLNFAWDQAEQRRVRAGQGVQDRITERLRRVAVRAFRNEPEFA